MIPIKIYLSPQIPVTPEAYTILNDVLNAVEAWAVWEPDEVHPEEDPASVFTAPPEWSWGPKWANVPLVPEKDVLFFCPCVADTNVRGCVWQGGATVMVCPKDDAETLELRTVHELCHALGLDADGMHAWIKSSLPLLLLYILSRLVGISEAWWQRQYYQHLLSTWRNL